MLRIHSIPPSLSWAFSRGRSGEIILSRRPMGRWLRSGNTGCSRAPAHPSLRDRPRQTVTEVSADSKGKEQHSEHWMTCPSTTEPLHRSQHRPALPTEYCTHGDLGYSRHLSQFEVLQHQSFFYQRRTWIFVGQQYHSWSLVSSFMTWMSKEPQRSGLSYPIWSFFLFFYLVLSQSSRSSGTTGVGHTHTHTHSLLMWGDIRHWSEQLWSTADSITMNQSQGPVWLPWHVIHALVSNHPTGPLQQGNSSLDCPLWIALNF